eukprot:TRINITY_DN2514_c0_g1_i2.p1 TRINITY_DN2514_c0_g1~~TRINITY_DN2514_c0_g1_i2.p1  ORF type:complete len:213 (+),score=29.43 TRINITY_DN2514_c0_g1_i2:223-861(+)
MGFARILLVSVLLLSVVQSALVKHNRAEPLGWEILSEKDTTNVKSSITFYLKHKNVEILKATVGAVSYPYSPSYGKYLSRDQLADLISDETAIQKVMGWLYSQGVFKDQIELLHTKDVIKVRNLDITTIEKMMNVPLSLYKSKFTQDVIARSAYHYNVPTGIMQYIDVITGVSDFPTLFKRDKPFYNSYMDRINKAVIESDFGDLSSVSAPY